MPELDLTNRHVYKTWTQDMVRYRDLDPNGHVNNGAINQYFEDGRVYLREERMADLGGNILRGFAIKKFTATYHEALSYPATIDVGRDRQGPPEVLAVCLGGPRELRRHRCRWRRPR